MTALDQLKAELTERVVSFAAALRKEIAAELLDKLGESEAPPPMERRVMKRARKAKAPKVAAPRDEDDEELDEDVDAIIERSVAARAKAGKP